MSYAPARARRDLPRLRRLAMLLGVVCGACWGAWVLAADAPPPQRYAGTYRIADWRGLEERGLYHFFYLHPDGHFLLQAAWPGQERSRFVGTWSVTEDRLHLNGQGSVETSQGNWNTEFSRSYRIRVAQAGFILAPDPVKNRFGLLGWPNAYHFYRHQPVPNLPDAKLPTDEAGMAHYIAGLLAARK